MCSWVVPRLWDGHTVAVLASGPSMSQAVADKVKAAGVPAIVINRTFELAPWAAMLYGADAEFWRQTPAAHQFAGLKVTCSDVPDVHRLKASGSDGFDPKPGFIRTGGNSGYQAVHIAAQAGARRILLCGFDMTGDRGAHWHGEHQHPLRETGPGTFERWVKAFPTLVDALSEIGVAVLNATPGSALRCARFVDLEEALDARGVPAA
jgi:hypothetical protein